MNRPILSCWIDAALELERENIAMAELMTNLIVAIARNADTLAMARGELAEKESA